MFQDDEIAVGVERGGGDSRPGSRVARSARRFHVRVCLSKQPRGVAWAYRAVQPRIGEGVTGLVSYADPMFEFFDDQVFTLARQICECVLLSALTCLDDKLQ